MVPANSVTNVPIKNAVLRSGQHRFAIVTDAPDGSFVFFNPSKISPVSQPSRIRVGTHTRNVKNGLTPKRSVPNALMPKHWIKLVIPNTPPKIAPATGPNVTAPTATGTTIRVISSPAVLI